MDTEEANKLLVDSQLIADKRMLELKEIDTLTHCIDKLERLDSEVHDSYGNSDVLKAMRIRIIQLTEIEEN